MTTLHQLTATTGLPCRTIDPALWFSDNPTDRRYAARQCGTCPTLLACRLFALETRQQWGVWGGVDMTGVETHCGSSRGFQIHRRNGEQPCEACQDAHDEQVERGRRERLAIEHGKGGTVRGYNLHRMLDEPGCEACRTALGRWSKERRERERAAAEQARNAWDTRKAADGSPSPPAGVQSLALAG